MEIEITMIRSDEGNGNWSLHPSGHTGEQYADGDVHVLASGTAEWDDDAQDWDRPNNDDYAEAEAIARNVTVFVDPEFDLAQAGYCICEQCCERFFAAYCAAAEEIADSEEIEITVERASYSTCGDSYDPRNIWQSIHDAITWTDHDDLAGKDTVENWDTVATYTATFPDGDTDGCCTVAVQIGAGENGYWYGRTSDDAGGSDDAPSSPLQAEYRSDAVEWAEGFAAEMDDAPDEDGIIAEILSDGWFTPDVTADDIARIADEATGRQSGGRIIVSRDGRCEWVTGNAWIEEDGWVYVGAEHEQTASALLGILQAIRAEEGNDE